MYQVLARRWRPQKFDELIGQDHVARTLGNAVASGRLAHAYIFAGVRGTGKTTVARIFAKCLNCEQGPMSSPCGTCAPCQEIAASRSMDVLEIDAASRTKVEQTRELLEMVSYAPVRDRYKILIIDEAHMLSKHSFNALLKTLEEPPPNVLFVLATTELHKILPTIVSRCQVFDFRRVSASEVSAHLARICVEGGITISTGALDRIARAGEGSVRDSLSLLERALAFCGEQVEDEDVLRMLGAVRAQVLVDVIGALARRDAAGMLEVLDGLVDEGHDLVHFWNELISALRDLLVLDSLGERKELLTRTAAEAEALQHAAAGLGREDLSRAFAILADLEPGLKNSSQPRFLFEAVLIRLASLGAVRPIEELLAGIGSGGTDVLAAAKPKQRDLADGRAQPEPTRRPTSAPRDEHPRPRPAPESRPPRPASAKAPTSTRQDVEREELLDAVRNERPMLAAVLEQASAVEIEGGVLAVRFPPDMAFARKQCEQPESTKLLRETVERLAGGPVQVRITADEAQATAEDEPGDPEPRGVGQQPPRPAAARPAAPQARLLETARREPGVKKLLDTFGAQVVEIGPFDVAGGADEAEAVGEPDSTEEP